ncbi:MAG TPA: S53 family peptidase [Pyrinomonadaceae bacterium]
MNEKRVILAGTQRLHKPERQRLATVRGNKLITVTVTLRGKSPVKPSPLGVPVRRVKHLTTAEANRSFSHTAKDEAAVRRFADAYDLHYNGSATGSIQLRGAAKQLGRAFGVTLCHYNESKYDSKYHGHDEEVTLPAYLKNIVTGVFGLDSHPVAHRPCLTHRMSAQGIPPPPVTSQTREPAEFARLYNFPVSHMGAGQSLGLLEFGGGFRRHELNSYFTSLGAAIPRVIVKEIAPGSNRPRGKRGTLNSDTEVYMDLELVASLAPRATIVAYFGENTEQGWIRTLQAAILDPRHDLSVISISWGEAEEDWSPQATVEIDKLFQLAALRGITICCSSGDNGISELTGQRFTVAFPASSPHVLACGGTRLEVKQSGQRSETVWNQWRQFKLASGGGVSKIFALPLYQKNSNVPSRASNGTRGRGIPDVAANASSDTGYLIVADKTRMSMGGTSAAAPLWAALIVRLDEALGIKLGFLTPLLYAMKESGADAVFDIVKGFNGPTRTQGYRARHGWDACTGLGSPHGEEILEWLLSINNKKVNSKWMKSKSRT